MRRVLVVLLAALGGGLTGQAAWEGQVRAHAGAPPPGWILDANRAPYRLASLAGPLAPRPDAWSLSHWQATRRNPALGRGPAALSASVLLPEGGELGLWAAADPRGGGDAGVALVLERVGAPSSRVVQAGGGARRTVRCSGELPAPDAAWVEVGIAPAADGLTARVNGVEVRCQVTAWGLGPALVPGLRRVQVRALEVDGEAVPPPGPEQRGPWLAVPALLAAGLAALELRRLRAGLVALFSAPLLLAGLLVGRDLGPAAETLRAPAAAAWLGAGLPLALAALARLIAYGLRALTERRAPGVRDWPAPAVVAAALPVALAAPAYTANLPVLAVAVAGVGGLGAVGVALRLALRRLGSMRPGRAATWILGFGSAATLGVVALGPLGPAALAGASTGGVALGLLLWANANAARVRAFNGVSLLAVAMGLGAAELALRDLPQGQRWAGQGSRTQADDVYGWVPTAWAEFAALEEATPTRYPSEGYPVAIPARGAPTRLVALGGSTTGGAFQNDDLSEFYPARLAEVLGPQVEVLNQGVGGWTTWHIRQYLDRQMEALDPDIVVLYVGHNDLLTPVPLPYAQLYAAWRDPGVGAAIGAALGRLRLYQGLRYSLAALRPADTQVAVPLRDAEQNLRAIRDAVVARGGQVVLASEGLAPDPGPLLAYNAQMAALAEGRADTLYVDTAGALHATDGPPVFLDDCHLTPAGHALVAQTLADALRSAGKIPPDDAP